MFIVVVAINRLVTLCRARFKKRNEEPKAFMGLFEVVDEETRFKNVKLKLLLM